MKSIAIIPARKGSKRVPGKNIKILGNKPLIQYTIDHALQSRTIDLIYITSDDQHIKELATKSNCTFINRPSEYSADSSSTIDVIKHFLHMTNLNNEKVIIHLLQPTVPFRRSDLTDESTLKMNDGDYDSITSHIKVDFFHPNRLKSIKGNYLTPYNQQEDETCSRSDLPPVYCRDGSIYSFWSDRIIPMNSIFGTKQGYVLNDPSMHVNIDTPTDWYLAQALLEKFSAQ